MEWLKKYESFWGKIVFFAALLVYANTISNDYNLDDELVTRNHRLTSQGISAIPEIISSYYYEDKFGHRYDYRPVVHICFALEHELFGESPHISHLINTLLYAVMCWLLWLFLSQLFPQSLKMMAWMATLLFAFHPMHTEVVASIKNRDEILALGFALASGLILLRGFSKGKFLLHLILAAILLTIGFLSKVTVLPMALILPLGLLYFAKGHEKRINIQIASNVFLLIAAAISDTSFLVKSLIVVGGNILLFTLELFSPKNNFKVKLSSWFSEFFKSNTSFTQNFDNWKNGFGFFKWGDTLLKSWFIVLINLVFFGVFVLTVYTKLHLSFFAFPLLFLGLLISIRYFEIYFSSLLIFLGIVLLNGKINIWEVNFFANMAFSLVIFFQNRNKFFQSSLAFTTIFFSLFLQQERLIRPEILFLILFPLIAYFTSHHKNSRYGYWFFCSIPVVVILKILTMLLDFQFHYGFIAIVLFVPVSVYLVFKKQLHFLPLSLLLVSLFIVTDRQAVFLSEFLNIEEKTEQIQQKVFFDDAMEGETYRPLFFVESPVNMQNSLDVRLGTGMFILSKYIKKLVLPYSMGFYYGYAYVQPYSLSEKVVFLLLVVVFLSFVPIAIYFRAKGNDILSFSLIILFIAFLPILNVFFPIAGVMADRYLFIPSIGFCLLIAYGINNLIENKKLRVAGFVVFVLILIAYWYLTINRNFEWKDKLTLFENDIEYLHQSAQAHALLGAEYMAIARNLGNEEEQKNWITKSKLAYENAISIYPEFWNWHFINGINSMSLGLYEEAINSYKKSIEKKPGFSHEPYYYIGYIYFEQGKFNEAVEYFEQTLNQGYQTPEIYNYLAACYSSLNSIENAISSLMEGLALFPNDYNLNLNTGKAYFNLGDNENAKIFLSKALSIDSRDSNIVNLLKSIE